MTDLHQLADRIALPPRINLGSGKDFRDDFFNVDVDPSWSPDAVLDLSSVPQLYNVVVDTIRFGRVTLGRNQFEQIIANDVLEHVPDLSALMTACLNLLKVGGFFDISVPYDLSFGAWQDPTHIRAFNERSWLYYTDWFWYLGWDETRFVLDALTFVPSPLGTEMQSQGMSVDQITRSPRAIDSMSVRLRKVELDDRDQAIWANYRESKRRPAR
jgi:SAM-dependent methyltransferase